MSKLESIIVSFNCLDLLSLTLPKTLEYNDHVIIVTKPDDIETQKYCESLNNNKLSVCVTDVFTYDGAKFNKGLAIALAMRQLKFNDWIITQDTDIIIPDNFKEKFLSLSPDIEYFYGMRRVNIDTRQDFEDWSTRRKNEEDFICYRGSGYGYWACCNYNSKIYQSLLKKWGGFGYPFWIKEAREIDWIWRNHWGERAFNPPLGQFPDLHNVPNQDFDTGLYKELPWKCIHLGMPGLNHENRVTERF